MLIAVFSLTLLVDKFCMLLKRTLDYLQGIEALNWGICVEETDELASSIDSEFYYKILLLKAARLDLELADALQFITITILVSLYRL